MLFGRQSNTEGNGQRARARSSIFWFMPQRRWSGSGSMVKPKARNSILVSHLDGRVSRTEAIFHCPSGLTCRKLDRKQNSQDSNQAGLPSQPDGMLVQCISE